MSDDLSQFSLIELFRLEAEGQIAVLTKHLLELEQGPAQPKALEAMMRAAHSLKGAGSIVGLTPAVKVAHVMEDCFVEVQKGRVQLGRAEIDAMLRGVDLLSQVSRLQEAEVPAWTSAHAGEVSDFARVLAEAQSGVRTEKVAVSPVPAPAAPVAKVVAPAPAPAVVAATVSTTSPVPGAGGGAEPMDRVLRVTAEKLNRLLGLAGESLVESRRLQPFNRSLLRLKRVQQELGRSLERLREALGDEASDRVRGYLREVQARATESRTLLQERMEEIDRFDRAATQLSGRLYREAQAVRMRPFADGVAAFPRMVRDLAHQLGKDARLTVAGGQTQVDRDVLEKIEAPLTHLLRNAVDHGLETAEARINAGKAGAGEVRLEARHRAGMLIVTVTDDGRGHRDGAGGGRAQGPDDGGCGGETVAAGSAGFPFSAGVLAADGDHGNLGAGRGVGRGAIDVEGVARHGAHPHAAGTGDDV